MKSSSFYLRAGMVLALCVGGLTSAYAVGNDSPAAVNVPKIFFTGGKDEPNDNTCSVEIKAGTYKFKGDDPNKCDDNDLYWYRIENVPSAALITLHDDQDCRAEDDDDWWVTLRVYINPTTTEWKKISDLLHYSKGDIVTKGIMIEDLGFTADDGELSCMIIDY